MDFLLKTTLHGKHVLLFCPKTMSRPNNIITYVNKCNPSRKSLVYHSQHHIYCTNRFTRFGMQHAEVAARMIWMCNSTVSENPEWRLHRNIFAVIPARATNICFGFTTLQSFCFWFMLVDVVVIWNRNDYDLLLKSPYPKQCRFCRVSIYRCQPRFFHSVAPFNTSFNASTTARKRPPFRISITLSSSCD